MLARHFAILTFIFHFSFFTLNFPPAYAAETDWTVHIKVSAPDSRGADGTAWNHLIAGVQDGATDGFDSAWDTLSLAGVYDPVQSMFTHGILPEDKNNDGVIDNWVCNHPESGYASDQCSLWRDMRAFGADKVWPFVVLSPLKGGDVTLEWAFDEKPHDMEIFLVNLSNPTDPIDMIHTSRYLYTNNFEAGKKYGIRYFEIRMKAKGLFIFPPVLPDATVNTPYRQSLSAVGGLPLWSLENGEIPPGMSVDAYTGEMTGTPTATGTYQFTVKGYDPASGSSSLKEYTLDIHSMPEIDVSSLPDGVVGTGYSVQVSVTGGSAPITWGIKGNLPEGAALDRETGIIAGTLIIPGIYDFTVTVKDANGAADSKDFRVTVTEPSDQSPPGAIDDLNGIYAADNSVLLMWSAPTDDSMTHTAAVYDLRYLEDCPGVVALDEGSWSRAIEASGEPRPVAGAIQTYTLTGIRSGVPYCIAMKSMDASGNMSPLSNIVTVPLSSNTGMSTLSELTSSVALRKGYNLISFPLIPVPNGRDTLFSSIIGTPVALYRWYSAYPGITPPQYYLEDVVQPGMGYFLYSPADIRFDIHGLKLTDSEYPVSLQYGWNMIGTPYDKAILLQDIAVRDHITGGRKSFIDAVKGGQIGNTLYYLGEGGYDFASFNDDPPAAFEPWVGYWIYVNDKDGVEMIFRKP